MKTVKKVLCLILALFTLCTLCACGRSRGGDGKTTCKNCGRKTKLSEVTGYCKTCDEGFWEWQAEQKK